MSVEVTRDEADKQVELQRVLQRRRNQDRSATVYKDPVTGQEQGAAPDKRMRWMNSRDRAVERAKDAGFVITPKDCDTKPRFGRWDETKGGWVQGEDLILMHEPIEFFEAKRDEDMDRERKMRRETNIEARERINRIARDGGGPAHTDVTFDHSREGEPVTIRQAPKR